MVLVLLDLLERSTGEKSTCGLWVSAAEEIVSGVSASVWIRNAVPSHSIHIKLRSISILCSSHTCKR